MGFGKSQKQKRNLEMKLAKKKEAQKKNFEMISSMDNNRSYSLRIDGKPVLGGMYANAKFWKSLYGISTD